MTLWSIGIGVGSLLCGTLSKDGVEIALVPLGAMGMTVFSVVLGLSGLLIQARGPLVAIGILGVTVSAGLYIVPITTLMQRLETRTHLSRVIAANNVFNALFIVMASVLLFGASRLGLTIPQTFLMLGGLNLLVSTALFTLAPDYSARFLAWLRERRTAKVER